MNPFDLIIVIVLLWAAIAGFRDGLLRQVFSWVGFALGLFVAYNYGEPVAARMGCSLPVAFLCICIGVPLLGSLLASLLTKLLDVTMVLGLANRMGGVALSLLKYALLASFIVYFGQKVMPAPEQMQTESVFYSPLLRIGEFIWSRL
ncbi:MAG: CvpA family protein [Bacteroidaceae bacterium]|nr:CvpA family protein [Bacteroidaceae bacterium]